MSERMYYRLSLALPFVAGAIWTALTSSSDPGERGIRQFVLWMALAPYALFAIGLTIWSIEKPTRTIRNALLFSPLLFTVIVALVAFPLTLLVFGSGLAETFVTLAPIVLVVGYTCVAAALLLRVLFRAVGVIRPHTPAAGPTS